MARQTAIDFVPHSRSISKLRAAAMTCEGCDLYRRATQIVFGEGVSHARLILVGEQPGDQEDRAGHPFVGVAGRFLDEALEAAGIDRSTTYVTNMVKHFKWIPRGTRRLHAKPSARGVTACRPWLEAEIAAIDPELMVFLGATAAQGLLGRAFRITRQRGELIAGKLAPWILATYHPAAILRAPEEADRKRMRREFINDLQVAARHLAKSERAHARARGDRRS
jgi:uracil-DNA glycosylase